MKGITIDYYKPKPILLNNLEEKYVMTDDDKEYNYNPFKVNSIQNYQPIYKLFFDFNTSNYNKISLKNRYHFYDLENVIDVNTGELINKNVFIKYSPLLDPIHYIIGKYDTNDIKIKTLPKISSTNEECHKKLVDKNNASYIDGFFSFLSAQLLHSHNFFHAVDFFGSYLAVQQMFKMNIFDDYEYICDSTFYLENKNKLFYVSKNEPAHFRTSNSRANKQKLNISNTNNGELLDLGIEEIEVSSIKVNEINNSNKDFEEVYSNNNEKSSSDTSSSFSDDDDNDTNENNNDENNEDDDDTNDEDDETVYEDCSDEEGNEDDSDEEEPIFAYIKDFPVQMICQEKCEGTLDELFEKELLDEEQGASALFQVIMILITYQKAFHFTHNDLHTNNIMYSYTDKKYLYYKYNGLYYKVPTYGKVFKIIDFGRSIYTFKGELFCSDSFAKDGDGSTQYNFEPYYNSKKPIINPNYSFDLCRLGCSIYDLIIDNENPNKLDDLQKTIVEWCKDDENKSILYKKNGEERYPGFKLYKMIARNVHNHTPEKQLNRKIFNQFLFKPENLKKNLVMNIDKIPVYV